jgi:hypothetical protein
LPALVKTFQQPAIITTTKARITSSGIMLGAEAEESG